MQGTPHIFLFVMLLVGVLGLTAIIAGLKLCPAKPSRLITIAAALPAILMLGLFYSLALHMRTSLDAWPTLIGDEGFPNALAVHGDVASAYFYVFFLTSIFAGPAVFLLCAFVRRWRARIFYLGIYALSFLSVSR